MPKDTFRECRSKVNITGLPNDLSTLTATTLSILELSRWNKNWTVRNSHSYIATATKIRFHLATLKILRFLLKTYCRRGRRGWWYHVPHSSLTIRLFSVKIGDLYQLECYHADPAEYINYFVTCYEIYFNVCEIIEIGLYSGKPYH